MKYVIKDYRNGYVVYAGDDIRRAKKEFDRFNSLRGDWVPLYGGEAMAELIRVCLNESIPCWEPVNLLEMEEIIKMLKEWLAETNQVGFATRYDATAFCMGYYGGLGYNQYEAINKLFVEGDLQA